MGSEGGIPSTKNPSSAGTGSDDEISVIAVIKKGTSGIPKRARYHYIRELPLTSVKALKKSFEKSGKETQRRASISGVENIPENSASTGENPRIINSAKKSRVIELSDEISKNELRRQFKITENSNEDEEEGFHNAGISSSSNNPAESNIIRKLPPGTVLIKQEAATPQLEIKPDNAGLSDNLPEINEPRNNANESSAGATSATTSTSSSNTNSSGSSASSITSCGSGSSSGGFGSGSPSPLAKAKRLHRASASGSRKKIADVVPRRNPKRSGCKKVTTIAEVAISTAATTSTIATRPRQRRLLATRRQERIGGGTAQTATNRRTKAPTMPYMNTRSVTRKLYTVGATYQAPTRKDETEWRDWPAHGMHERPVFHPQIGLAAGYAGRVFWSTTNAQGSNWTYREILDASEDVEIVPVDPCSNGMQSTPPQEIKTVLDDEPSEESFEVCMHDSLHSVLAYCAQIMAPGYGKMMEKNRRHGLQEAREELAKEFSAEKKAELEYRGKESTQLSLSQLEDSSISDETLMEMSSIYKKLLPIEDQPSSREGSPPPPPPPPPSSSSSSSVNTYSIRKPAEGGSKNSNEASEIARILSEYNEGLKETSIGRPFSSTIPVTALRGSFMKEIRDSVEPEVQQKTLVAKKPIVVDDGAKLVSQETEVNGDHWLEDLLVDTSLLYCVATGVDQRGLTEYFDSLDAKQSLQWLKRRDG